MNLRPKFCARMLNALAVAPPLYSPSPALPVPVELYPPDEQGRWLLRVNPGAAVRRPETGSRTVGTRHPRCWLATLAGQLIPVGMRRKTPADQQEARKGP